MFIKQNSILLEDSHIAQSCGVRVAVLQFGESWVDKSVFVEAVAAAAVDGGQPEVNKPTKVEKNS